VVRVVEVWFEVGELFWAEAGGENGAGGFLLVERVLARCWSRWPLNIAVELGGCRQTWTEVRAGQVAMWPTPMAAHQVERAGENMAA
jgi:hypothetical protein